MNPYLADRAIAPPGQEGWTRHQEKYREASFDGADGVVVQDQTEMFLNLNHHPVCAASDASHFLTGAATPPGQEGRWPGTPQRSTWISRFIAGREALRLGLRVQAAVLLFPDASARC